MFKNLLERKLEPKLSVPTKRHNIIVSMTSTSSRLASTHITIKTILNQTMPADKVVIWLSEDSYLYDEGVDPENLPEDIQKLCKEGLTIQWTNNTGPYRKLIPILKIVNDQEQLIITADDDVLYPQDWIEKLYTEYVKYPDCIICYRGRKIARDQNGKLLNHIKWKRIRSSLSETLLDPSIDILPIGRDGVLYPRKIFNDQIFDEETFMLLAPTNDDIWFKAMSMVTKTKVKNIASLENLQLWI